MSSPKRRKLSTTESAVDDKIIYMVASGDLRLSANQKCWPVQDQLEKDIIAAFQKEGYTVKRAHDYDPVEKHGFISSQRQGMNVFKSIPKAAKLIVAEAVWQYSHHVLAGLRDHEGSILCLGNWNPTWPGLVGLLNLTASLTKMNKKGWSSIWTKDCTDEYFVNGIREWLKKGSITHDVSHNKDFTTKLVDADELAKGRELAEELRTNKAIMGVFDEGCMGMYNAFFDDELLNPMGIYKERLSQSALVAAMRLVSEKEAEDTYQWMVKKGMKFNYGKDPKTELTKDQVIEQCKMYVAAGRIAFDFGCDVIGIQYQQGLKDMVPASDLAEGMLNNVDRPPIHHINTRKVLYEGKPIPHFNEVDEGCAVDALVTSRVWAALGEDPSTTLHDVRFGEHFKGTDLQGHSIDHFVWVFEISGSAPPSHFREGWEGAISERQPPMYFPLGGGTLKGISRHGEIVWSRVFMMNNVLHADLGRGTVVELPHEETERRLRESTPEWPIMNVVLHGVNRDQLMARHKSNHIQVVYCKDAQSAVHALNVKAAMFHEMGLKVHFMGSKEWNKVKF